MEKSVIRRSNLLCIQNQSIHSIIHRSIPGCSGEVSVFIHHEWFNSNIAQLALCQLGGGIAEGVIAQQISLFSSNASIQQINISTGVCVSKSPLGAFSQLYEPSQFTDLEWLQRRVRSVNCNLHDLLSILRFLYVFFSYFLNF
jgi:hypothetical protein